MKPYLGTISILKNTNRATSSTEENWSTIRQGSLVQIEEDFGFYSVVETKPIYFQRKFQKANNNLLKTDKDNGIDVFAGDVISIIYDEYELATLYEIKEKGVNYKKGDILNPDSGKASFNIQDGTEKHTVFEVDETDENGGIKKLKINNLGKYINFPSKITSVSGGNGKDCILDLHYKLTTENTVIERTVISVSKNAIQINHPLPAELQNGFVSCQKWELFLASNYLNNDKVGATYKVYQDITPFLGLPKMAKNSVSFDIIFNRTIEILDSKIKELEGRIKN